MENKKFKPIDMSKIKEKKSTYRTTQEAIKDVTPLIWSRDVLEGKQKITVKCMKFF